MERFEKLSHVGGGGVNNYSHCGYRKMLGTVSQQKPQKGTTILIQQSIIEGRAEWKRDSSYLYRKSLGLIALGSGCGFQGLPWVSRLCLECCCLECKSSFKKFRRQH